MIQAVVYTSNTGSTEQYARLLGQETGLPVCSLTEARKTLSAGTQILYLGWVMAGSIQGYADAARLYRIPMICAVGMEPAGKEQELRKKTASNRMRRCIPFRAAICPTDCTGFRS